MRVGQSRQCIIIIMIMIRIVIIVEGVVCTRLQSVCTSLLFLWVALRRGVLPVVPVLLGYGHEAEDCTPRSLARMDFDGQTYQLEKTRIAPALFLWWSVDSDAKHHYYAQDYWELQQRNRGQAKA